MKRKTLSDYNLKGLRTAVVKVSVNQGEKDLINDAVERAERIFDRSAWAHRVLMREACIVLGFDPRDLPPGSK